MDFVKRLIKSEEVGLIVVKLIKGELKNCANFIIVRLRLYRKFYVKLAWKILTVPKILDVPFRYEVGTKSFEGGRHKGS